MSHVSRMRRTRACRRVLAALFVLMAASSTVSAQTPPQRPDPLKTPPPPERDPEWSVEFRGGFAAQSNPSTGTGQLPLPNARVDAGAGAPAGRVVSSWLFGDGAAQWNSVFPTVPIASLDNVMQSAAAHRPAGGTFGFTLGKRNSDHWRTDLGVDVFVSPLTFTPAAKASLEAARQSFVTAFTSVFSSLSPDASATVTGPLSGGREAQVTVDETYDSRSRAPWSAFVSVGAGIVLDTHGPVATINGTANMTFASSIGTVLLGQNDTVRVRTNDGQFRWTAILGGGVDRRVSAHRGIRIGVHAGITTTRLTTLIDATPLSTGSGAPIGLALTNGDSGVILGRSGLPVSLSGPKLANFPTFNASGLRVQVLVSAGYYFRF